MGVPLGGETQSMRVLLGQNPEVKVTGVWEGHRGLRQVRHQPAEGTHEAGKELIPR